MLIFYSISLFNCYRLILLLNLNYVVSTLVNIFNFVYFQAKDIYKLI